MAADHRDQGARAAVNELKERWRKDDFEQQAGDLKRLMDSVWGRRIYGLLASIGGVYRTQGQDERFEYAAGRRDCALRFMHLCREASAVGVAKSLTEAAEVAQLRSDEIAMMSKT